MPTAPIIANRLAMRDYPVDSLAIMEQQWRDLLFLHWEYDPADIQKKLPKGLYVDLFQNKAYIGLIPFFMDSVRVKMMPFVPGLSSFLELNCRTYVYDEAGNPGVWFFSLDANSQLAVQMANSFFYLPYIYAQMMAKKEPNEQINYQCQREGRTSPVDFIYQKTGAERKAQPDTLDFFLIERYALYVHKGEQELALGRVHHHPYPIYDAIVEKWDNSVFDWNGLKKPERPPEHICFSPGVDVEIFALTNITNF